MDLFEYARERRYNVADDAPPIGRPQTLTQLLSIQHWLLWTNEAGARCGLAEEVEWLYEPPQLIEEFPPVAEADRRLALPRVVFLRFDHDRYRAACEGFAQEFLNGRGVKDGQLAALLDTREALEMQVRRYAEWLLEPLSKITAVLAVLYAEALQAHLPDRGEGSSGPWSPDEMEAARVAASPINQSALWLQLGAWYGRPRSDARDVEQLAASVDGLLKPRLIKAQRHGLDFYLRQRDALADRAHDLCARWEFSERVIHSVLLGEPIEAEGIQEAVLTEHEEFARASDMQPNSQRPPWLHLLDRRHESDVWRPLYRFFAYAYQTASPDEDKHPGIVNHVEAVCLRYDDARDYWEKEALPDRSRAITKQRFLEIMKAAREEWGQMQKGAQG